MRMKDIFSLALTNIRHRQLRSWLTILGIVIGVASIISLIGISMGMSTQINSRLSSLGSNIITVSPGGQQSSRVGGFSMGRPGGGGAPGGFGGQESSTQAITFKEADILSTLPGIYRLDPRLSKRETIQYQNKNSSATIVGTNPAAFADTVGVNISTGRYLNSNDGYSAVVGFNIANQTFDDLDMLNKQLKINGVSFHIVGVLAQSGSGGGFGGSDGSVYIPLSAAKQLFNESTDASQLVVVVSPNHDTDTVASEIDSELLDLHMVTEDTKDFTITTASTMQAAMASVTDTLSLFLAGIASISLLVGGIGVANTMFMSVLEQTKDIGVMKSLGAKNRDIIFIFICEAGTIGFIGGALGVLLSFLVSYIITMFGLPSTLSLDLVLGGLGFSVLIGIIAGISPARNAAKIPPVEALKYE